MMAIPDSIQNFVLLIARVLYSPIFIISGIGKATHFAQNTLYFASKGLPFPEFFLTLAIAFELGGSILILTGWHARIGAMMIFIFVLVASFMVHTFWNYPLEEASNQMTHFMKNFSIMGGALFIMLLGPGRYSFGYKDEDQKVQK